jgi:hypothetical protein
MINTLKISDFVNPQKLIALTNAENNNFSFSEWDVTIDKKYLVSTLLFEHIALIHENNINKEKLLEISYKVNFDAPKKLLLLLHTKTYFLYELIDKETVILSFGKMNEFTTPIFSQKVIKKKNEVGFLYIDKQDHAREY